MSITIKGIEFRTLREIAERTDSCQTSCQNLIYNIIERSFVKVDEIVCTRHLNARHLTHRHTAFSKSNTSMITQSFTLILILDSMQSFALSTNITR